MSHKEEKRMENREQRKRDKRYVGKRAEQTNKSKNVR
jgi:hypothetical protein